MPTLFRFLIILCTMAALTCGAIVALAFFVVPREREITVRIPSERLDAAKPVVPAKVPETTSP